MKSYIKLVFILCCITFCVKVSAQERVYVSTDKECYLAGDDVWISVFCINDSLDNSGILSKVAYLEFHTKEGNLSTIKIALKRGRGCGKFQIPLSFPTGNYSIVSYTKNDGGESVDEFKGKIITIFNTLSNERVKDGVEVVEQEKIIDTGAVTVQNSNLVSIDIKENSHQGTVVPISVRNTSDNNISLNVSIYCLDKLNSLVEGMGYNKVSLLDRKGNFKPTGEVDYAGEVIKVRITPKSGDVKSIKDQLVYMSAMGNTDDIFANYANHNGQVAFYTNNIYGNRDLVFEIVGDTSKAYNVEIVKSEYMHKAAEIPILKISSKMQDALLARGMNMQVVKRFDADTLYNLMDIRETSSIGTVEANVYNLDDYTRFPVMEEAIREYVKELRVRKDGGETVLKVLWDSQAKPLVLLDGVSVLDHAIITALDPLLIKQILVYPKRYILNNIVYDGIVKFNSYRKDMGGIKLGKNVTIDSHRGVQYPLGFLGDNVKKEDNYPNLNNTIYWNPVVNVKAGETFDFECVKPQYKGSFKVVAEGIDSKGNQIYSSGIFTIQ